MAMNLRVVQANEFFETAFHTPLLPPPCHHIAASHESARKRDHAYSRTFQGVCACGFGRLGCRATRKRQAQHHTTKVRTARPQTLPSSHASAMAAILWGPRAHHRGTGGEVREEVTRAPHKERHSTQPQLVESHGIPAFLHEMTEDVVTQQHGARAHTNGKAQFAYAIAYTVTSTPNLSSQFPFLRRNAHTHTLGACAVPPCVPLCRVVV